jgi:uncharacterized protein (TIGR02646 family)
MIRVDRPVTTPADVLAVLDKLLTSGQTELEAAREYYSAVPPPKKAYKFLKYKAFEVCRSLDTLFHGKCAYCESPYRAVDALDIEHFRPKGGVSEATAHPGYWWLAAVWTNLLPSCPACNQRRRHAQYVPGMTAEEFEHELQREPMIVTGKGNAFPVRDNNWIVIESLDLSVEDPLLINPCERDPKQHLEWAFDRDPKVPIWQADPIFSIVRPRKTDDGTQDEYGQTSIAIYGLNRSGIVRERTARVKEMQRISRPIVDALLDLAAIPDSQGDAAVRLRVRLSGYKSDLLSFTHSTTRYSGMASAYVHEFDGELRKLSSAF